MITAHPAEMAPGGPPRTQIVAIRSGRPARKRSRKTRNQAAAGRHHTGEAAAGWTPTTTVSSASTQQQKLADELLSPRGGSRAGPALQACLSPLSRTPPSEHPLNDPSDAIVAAGEPGAKRRTQPAASSGAATDTWHMQVEHGLAGLGAELDHGAPADQILLAGPPWGRRSKVARAGPRRLRSGSARFTALGVGSPVP